MWWLDCQVIFKEHLYTTKLIFTQLFECKNVVTTYEGVVTMTTPAQIKIIPITFPEAKRKHFLFLRSNFFNGVRLPEIFLKLCICDLCNETECIVHKEFLTRIWLVMQQEFVYNKEGIVNQKQMFYDNDTTRITCSRGT